MNHRSDLIVSIDNEEILDHISHIHGDLIIKKTLRRDLGRVKSVEGDLVLNLSNISDIKKTVRVKGRVIPSPELKAAWDQGSDSWRRFPKL